MYFLLSYTPCSYWRLRTSVERHWRPRPPPPSEQTPAAASVAAKIYYLKYSTSGKNLLHEMEDTVM